MSEAAPQVSVVIATRNRKDDLRQAIQSALKQTVNLEVLVIDDGSTDGSAEMVLAEFPQIRLERSETSKGYIVQRNVGARLAAAPVIVSLDDDAQFSTPHTIAQTLAELGPPCVGAVAIPFINVRQDAIIRQIAPLPDEVYVTSMFVGTAYALRRDLFLKLDGYRESYFHQGEERDFCLRMLAEGYVVRLGRADPICHLESPLRDSRRMDLYGRRNDVLFAFYNVPLPWLPVHLAGTAVKGLWFGLRVGRPFRMALGLAYGFLAGLRNWQHREPVGSRTYRLNVALRKHGAWPLDQLDQLLPPHQESHRP